GTKIPAGHQPFGGGSRWTTFVAVSSSSSSGPYPKPSPLPRRGCAAPPGAPPKTALTLTVPTSSARKARCALLIEPVSTVAARPYREAPARRRASSNDGTVTTG